MTNASNLDRPIAKTWRCPALPLVILGASLLSACAGPSPRESVQTSEEDPVPAQIARIPDAVPRIEPRSKSGNPKSYVVFGKRYYTKPTSRGHVERGLASWYGEPFHGRRTSSGEVYDMYAMTAAHRTLPLPTYAEVTNLSNGRSVVVKINDRGPFHGPRVIDLSYTAAMKLGVVRKGTAMVEVRAIDPSAPNAKPRDAGPFLAQRETPAAVPGTPRPLQAAAPSKTASQPGPEIAAAKTTPATNTRAPAASVVRPPTPGADRPVFLQVAAFGNPDNAEKLRARLISHLDNPVNILDGVNDGTTIYKVRVGPLSSEQDAERLEEQLAALGVGPPSRVTP